VRKASFCIFWLNGMAGRGKSSVARTIAHTYRDRNQLGASFFFSRSASDTSKPDMLFTTIAVQLASSCPPLRTAIARAVEGNQHVVNETLRDQWEQLILQPLLDLDPKGNCTPLPLVLVIDALDECESRPAIGEILRLLPDANTITAIRIRIVITSRPDTSILRGFRAMAGGSYESRSLDHEPRDVVDQDISHFLRHRFKNIVLGSVNLPPDWPGEAAISSLVQQAEVSFSSPQWFAASSNETTTGPRKSSSPSTSRTGITLCCKPEREHCPLLRRLPTSTPFTQQPFDNQWQKSRTLTTRKQQLDISD
jgi:hypothetical protein